MYKCIHQNCPLYKFFIAKFAHFCSIYKMSYAAKYRLSHLTPLWLPFRCEYNIIYKPNISPSNLVQNALMLQKHLIQELYQVLVVLYKRMYSF